MTQLLSDTELAEASAPEAVRIPLGLVDPSPQNPRDQLPEIDVLAESILEHGLMQPIFVRRAADDRYEVLSGHRRRAAFLWLHDQYPFDDRWLAIPAVVRTVADDDHALRMLISSQLDTRMWRPREEAAMLERLMLTYGSLKRVGEALHRTESWASKRLRVYADSVLSGYVQSGRLSAGIAEEFLPIIDVEDRRRLAEQAATESWSLEQARTAARNLRRELQLPALARMTSELLALLEPLKPEEIPMDVARNLWTLDGVIQRLSGKTPKFPSIEAAQQAAGIKETRRQSQKRSERRKPGYVPKY